MLEFDFSSTLQKKIHKLETKNVVLSRIIRRKVEEIVSHDIRSIDTYKNLKSPLQMYKRIHLTQNFILLFQVDKENEFVLFVDVRHRDEAYD